MGRKLERDGWAARVFDVIPDAPERIHIADIAAQTGLTEPQVSIGIGYLRDKHPEWPLVSSPKGICWSEESDDVYAFRKARVKNARTVMFRTYHGAMVPFLPSLPARERRMVKTQFERVIEDLDMMLIEA